jgi:indolepyruvate ferredoxin oxidoreductase
MMEAVRAACREVVALPAAERVSEALGDLIYVNVYLLGVAHQRGLVPLSAEAINRALELNGTAVERNKEAFAAGRAAALTEPARAPAPVAPEAETLDALVARRVAELTAYQSARYAKRYADFVARVRAAETAALPGEERLGRAVAIQLYRLMAYKDEYEVARLHSLPEWREHLAKGFTGTRRVEMHLAPPLLARRDPATGQPRKMRFGPWMLRAMGVLRHGKALRGTVLDPFGYTEERSVERRLPDEFRAGIEAWLARPDAAAHGRICEWAEAWAGVRGFGHIKARNLAAVRERLAALAKAPPDAAPPLPLAAE